MELEKKEKIVTMIMKLFWVFIIGSLIGYLVESIVGLVQEGHWVSRKGLLYGPFIPVYGIGILAYYFSVPKIKGISKVFLFSMIMGGLVEYMCSFIQEKCFGTVSWDYTHLWLNINGRTSLLHCLYWGTGGVLFMQYVYPMIEKMDEYLNNANFKSLTTAFVIFMIFNISISYMAANRQEARMRKIEPISKMDLFLDRYYPDTVMDKVYANKQPRIGQ